ncbi:MAG: hypothetical protein WCY11_04370 [Novosphingobium sp.]
MNAISNTTPARAAPAKADKDVTNVIIIPSIKIMDIDLLDNARETLCTIHTALNPDNRPALDDDVLFALWATLRRSMDDLDHLREHLCDRTGGAQ